VERNLPVILPSADAVADQILAARLRQLVATTPLVPGGKTVPLMVSIGTAVFDPRDSNGDDAPIRADEARYRAMRGGRNRVETVARLSETLPAVPTLLAAPLPLDN